MAGKSTITFLASLLVRRDGGPILPLDGHGGSKLPAGVVLSLYGEIGPLRLQRRDGLETCAGEGVNWFELVRTGAGEHPPGCNLRSAVPAYVYFDFVSFTGFGNKCRRRLRLALPG